MRTHIERLPEYYPSKDEDLSEINWLTRNLQLDSILGRKHQGETGEMSIEQARAKQVLVIDDEGKFRDTYGRILLSMGFDVVTASNAMAAQSLMVRNKFDIILLDINMSEVDGSILFEVVRAFHKNIKVIVSSVYPVEEQKNRICGADGYYDKSDGKDVLVSLVSSLLAVNPSKPR